MAHKLLYDLSMYFEECILFARPFEIKFYRLCQKQLQLMRNTIDRNDEFYNQYFKDKTYREVMNWIEEESEKW